MLPCPQGHFGVLSPCFNVLGARGRLDERFRVVGRLRTTDKSWAQNGYGFRVANTLQEVVR